MFSHTSHVLIRALRSLRCRASTLPRLQGDGRDPKGDVRPDLKARRVVAGPQWWRAGRHQGMLWWARIVAQKNHGVLWRDLNGGVQAGIKACCGGHRYLPRKMLHNVSIIHTKAPYSYCS
jgi:hypothetical protein